MMYIFKPGAYNVTDAARATITQPGAAAAAAQWWLGPWPGFPLAAAIAPADCVAAYRAISTPGSPWGTGPANIAESYVNLNQPGVNDAAPGVAPTWAGATGWTFNGLTTYLTTGITIGAGYSALIQFADAADANGYMFGSGDITCRPRLAGGGLGGSHNYTNLPNGGAISIAGDIVGGNVAITNSGYFNGVWEAALLFPGSDPGAIVIGAINVGGILGHFDGRVLAFIIYNITIDAAQVAALGTAITGAMAQL